MYLGSSDNMGLNCMDLPTSRFFPTADPSVHLRPWLVESVDTKEPQTQRDHRHGRDHRHEGRGTTDMRDRRRVGTTNVEGTTDMRDEVP